MNKDLEPLAGLIAVIIIAFLLAWLIMLTLGNFGLSQFGYAETLPAGFLAFWFGRTTRR